MGADFYQLKKNIWNVNLNQIKDVRKLQALIEEIPSNVLEGLEQEMADYFAFLEAALKILNTYLSAFLIGNCNEPVFAGSIVWKLK